MIADTLTRQPATTAPGTRRPRVVLRSLLVAGFVILVGGGLVAFHQFKAGILKQVAASISNQMSTVSAMAAVTAQWQPRLTAPGALRASAGTDLSPEVAGIVEELSMRSGDDVAAGTLLLRLRANDDDAKLAQLQATADLNALTLARDRKQLAAQGVAQSTVDTDAANLRTARAQVEAQKALIAQKLIRAPFAGRLGLRLVDKGQYVSAGTTVITLQALDPVMVDFYLPQQAVGQVAPGAAVTLRVDAFPGQTFRGAIEALSSKIDATSRMVQVRAIVPNPGKRLLPGMFASVSVAAGSPVQRVIVPNAALTYAAYGSFVYVLEPQTGLDGKPRSIARQRFVTPGEQRGDQVAIDKGVVAGDQVVTGGQSKLTDRAVVSVNNSVQPTNDPAPKPREQ